MINLAREAWRPLFLREPVAQRGWSLVTRGLRAYLLQVAEDDGRLLKSCGDPTELARSLGVHDDEAELVEDAIRTLINDGFLRWEGAPGMPGWLGIDRLVTFGPAEQETASTAPREPELVPELVSGETAEERRRRLARERKGRWKSRRGGPRQRSTGGVPSVPESVPGNAPGHVPERTSPPTPPSPGDKNTKKTGQNRETPTREASVTGSVPGHVPAAFHASVPESVTGERAVDGDVLTALTAGKFDQAQALVRGSAAGESQEAAP